MLDCPGVKSCLDYWCVYSAYTVRLRSITRLMMKKSKCVGIVWKKLNEPLSLRWHLPNVLRHIRPRWDNKLGGVFLFLLVVNMRLGRMVTAALLGTAFAEYSCSSGSDWDSFLWGGAQQSKSKPNRVSQAKRRKYKRQGRWIWTL